MTAKPIVIASDHAGYELKGMLAEELRAMGCEVLDLGTDGAASVDYPDFADSLARAILEGRADQRRTVEVAPGETLALELELGD